jgi:ACS family hexuronate transporter-like MFS transporter
MRAKIEQNASGYRWVILFASLLAFIMYGFALQSVPPLLQYFKNIFNINDPTAGLLISMVLIPGIVLALPVGIIVDKYGFRKIGFWSVLTVSAGSLIMAISSSFTLAIVARLIIGFGGGVLTVGVPAIIPQWFERKEMGKAMGIFAVGVPIATTAAFFTAPILAQRFGWQSPFYTAGIISIISAILFWVTVKEGPLKSQRANVKLSEAWQAFRNLEVWKVSVVWMFFNMVAIGFLTWAPSMFVTFKGLDPVSASVAASLIMIANFFFVPFYGWASDKVGRRKPFLIAGSIAISLSLYIVIYATGILLPGSILILGISAGAVPPLVMAITAQSLPPKQAGMGFGVVTFWQNIGAALSSPIIGYFLQATQSLPLTFFGMSIFAFCGAAVALTVRSR